MRVVVLMGGLSREREISLRSGRRVVEALRKLGHDVVPLDVKEDFFEKISILKRSDVVFIALHGTFGEDGRIQAILDMLGVRYTGSGVLASSICFDKLFTYKVLKGIVPIPEYKVVKEVGESPMGYPCVIKPRREGSSIGVHICDDEREYKEKLKKELEVHKEMIVEEYIKGRELTVSILETENGFEVLPILELKPKRRFYDYVAKYTPGMTEFVLPAPLSVEEEKRVKEVAVRAFEETGCRGFGRVDGILKDGEFYFLEINTIPGLTELSDMPASAKAKGMSFEELVDTILRSAFLK
mgnify:CR=1 FL=1